MATTEQLQETRLGEPGEACAECGSRLAADQRYCLNCGARRGDPRLEYGNYLKNGGNGAEEPPGGPADPSSKQPGSGRDWTPFALVGLIAALGMMLAIGVLIGKGGSGSDQAAAPVVQVGGGTAADTASGGSNLPTANTSFKSDWPSGKDGYTVELGTLPKQGTTAEQVDAQKSDAESKGASDVGALDTDDYGSLPAGNYLVYSGVYDTKAEATKALKPLKSNFPDAKVVQVSTKAASGGKTVSANSGDALTSGSGGNNATVKASDQALSDLQNQSGQNYADASKHLPNNVATSGNTVKNDNKDPGAGTPAQVIK